MNRPWQLDLMPGDTEFHRALAYAREYRDTEYLLWLFAQEPSATKRKALSDLFQEHGQTKGKGRPKGRRPLLSLADPKSNTDLALRKLERACMVFEQRWTLEKSYGRKDALIDEIAKAAGVTRERLKRAIDKREFTGRAKVKKRGSYPVQVTIPAGTKAGTLVSVHIPAPHGRPRLVPASGDTDETRGVLSGETDGGERETLATFDGKEFKSIKP